MVSKGKVRAMTTIAWDGTTLAADKASWKGGYVWNGCTKLFSGMLGKAAAARFGLGTVAGCEVWRAACGSAAEQPLINAWLFHDAERPTLAEPNNTCGVLVVPRTGRAYFVTGLLTLEPITTVPMADGGGHEMALGAMLGGATAVQALHLVASRSSWCAGGVDCYCLPASSPPQEPAYNSLL